MTPPTRPGPNEPPIGDPARWIAAVLADDAPARQRAAAEEALRASDAGRRLLEALASFEAPVGADPVADEARVTRIMAAISALGAGELRRRRAGAPIPWAGGRARRIAAWGALAALVALALVTAQGALLGGELSGTAVESPVATPVAPDAAFATPLAAALLVAGALLAVALAWWLRRR